MRSRSFFKFGLWSTDRGIALPPSPSTHLESPALAHISRLPTIIRALAVHPFPSIISTECWFCLIWLRADSMEVDYEILEIYLLSAWNLRALSTGDVWWGCSLLICIIASIPFGVISILSNPMKVASNAFPKSFLDWNSGYSFSLGSKYLSQNFAHSNPPWPSKTANSPIPWSKLGFVMWASSCKWTRVNKWNAYHVKSPALHGGTGPLVASLSLGGREESTRCFFLCIWSIQIDKTRTHGNFKINNN